MKVRSIDFIDDIADTSFLTFNEFLEKDAILGFTSDTLLSTGSKRIGALSILRFTRERNCVELTFS